MKDELRERIEKIVEENETDGQYETQLMVSMLKQALQETAPKSVEAWQPKEGEIVGFVSGVIYQPVIGKYIKEHVYSNLPNRFLYKGLHYEKVIEITCLEDTVKTAEQLIKEGRRWI